MNELQLFKNDQFEVRTIIKDGQPMFVAADVCKALDLDSTATRRLDDDEKADVRLTQTSSNGVAQERELTAVTEPGLYALILGSRKPEAKVFKRWITHDVIPSIRTTGGYVDSDELFISTYLLNTDEATRSLFRATLATVRGLNTQIAEAAPKVAYYDAVLQADGLLTVTQIAKDFGKSARWLNKELAAMGVQFQKAGQWFLYQQYADNGYTQSKTQVYVGNDGEIVTKLHTYWTQLGRAFITAELAKHGIFPKAAEATANA